MNKLYVVATPIGNMQDITYRAIETLKNVDIILCEDTRRTLKLLNHYNISKKLISLHSYNEKKSVEKVFNLLKEFDLALVTDGGTPCISDPGSYLISELLNKSKSIKVIPIPGVSALTTLLSVCGLPIPHFYFRGFLSNKSTKRKKQLEELKDIKTILVIYESPHRIRKCLVDIKEIFPTKEIVIGRELTKIFETVYRGNINDFVTDSKSIEKNQNFIHISGNDNDTKNIVIEEKGEFVIAINNL